MSTLETAFERYEETSATDLRSSGRLLFLDHFRVPYALSQRAPAEGFEQLRRGEDGPVLLWKVASGGHPVAATLLGADHETEIPMFAEILPDGTADSMLKKHGGRWHRARELKAVDGSLLGSIWRCDDGSVLLPFDPNEVVESFWSERYLNTSPGSRTRPLRRALMVAYYRSRPLLPRLLQIWLRRQFSRMQARLAFPRWPIEPCLHQFFDLLFAILSGVAGGPVPHLAPWPDGHHWALVLTHDLEYAEGVSMIERVREVERSHGLRSSWNLVPRRYDVDPGLVRALADAGCEIGVHGIYHDGRDLESRSTWQRRLHDAHEAADRWGAVGFRSAALHRNWDWMRLLAMDYDSSSPDTDPFEPQNGGCCTWLPFFNGELVELPLTLPHDHALFVILRRPDETVWVEKARYLRSQGGLAMIDTHPDYMGDERIFSAYARLLECFADDATAWRALPREVSAWWRRRASSWLEHDGQEWRVLGAAADEARIVFQEGTW